MNGLGDSGNDSLALEVLERIETVCLEFEAAWQRGRHPKIEDYLTSENVVERHALLRELLLLDIDYVRRAGKSPIEHDYHARFPGDSPLISAIFVELATDATRSGTFADSTQSSSDQPSLPRLFGDYELLEEIGRGGMGVAYKARQLSLKRTVVVKMILRGRLARDTEVKRFRTEAEAAAGLQHPGIVGIHEVGIHEGEHYFSMDHVQGESLAALLRKEPLPAERIVEFLIAISQAVHYAHERGVLHRDLKPSNVLIDTTDQPRITDFGLAKRLEEDSDVTVTGELLGTANYMSPEQASGAAKQLGRAADVYSLGAMMYEMLTGGPPLSGPTALDTIMMVQRVEPTPPRKIAPRVPQDLETICLKCLAKEPTKRYRTARELADELERFRNGRPILARPINRAAKAWRWCKRHPVPAISATAVSMAVLAMVTMLTIMVVHQVYVERQGEQNDHKRAKSLVDAILTAPAEEIPDAIQNLEPLRDHAVPLLQESFADRSIELAQRLHAAIALAAFGHVEAEFLVANIGTSRPGECSNIVAALREDKDLAIELLRTHAVRAESEKDWRRKVRLAIVALYLDEASIARDMLRLRADPVQRTVFIDALPVWHGNLAGLARVSKDVDDSQFRSGISAAVGSIQAEVVSTQDREAWTLVWSHWYQNAPDTGTHSAANWALRSWQIELPKIPTSTDPVGNRDWYVNSIGVTMLKIPAGHFMLKDPRNRIATEQRVTLTRAFYLSAREVSIDLFRQFMEDEDTVKQSYWQRRDAGQLSTRASDCPTVNVGLFDAVLFCNWLSRKEGLTPCYVRMDKTEKSGSREHSVLQVDGHSVRMVVSGPKRERWRLDENGTGYRLPTEAEWEHACRAKSEKAYTFGDDEAMLRRHAVFRVFWESWAEPCGSRLPNGWGLFDMHGNVWELCHNLYGDSIARSLSSKNHASQTKGGVVWRGGGFAAPARWLRSTFRLALSNERPADGGFRLARTTPDYRGDGLGFTVEFEVVSGAADAPLFLGDLVSDQDPSHDRTVAVTGKVTLDGRPIEGATVSFVPVRKGEPATGRTDASGRYRLLSVDAGEEGAFPGEYLVGIVKFQHDQATGQRKNVLPHEYAAARTSGLVVIVTEEETWNAFDFKLVSDVRGD